MARNFRAVLLMVYTCLIAFIVRRILAIRRVARASRIIGRVSHFNHLAVVAVVVRDQASRITSDELRDCWAIDP